MIKGGEKNPAFFVLNFFWLCLTKVILPDEHQGGYYGLLGI